mmetsp:Transcript_17447/g.60929  ORF Transcript_17447/g.60929 Transcript_17447/m.60929 type:complete len:235 (-) Transcript_17447:647-1351(-)
MYHVLLQNGEVAKATDRNARFAPEECVMCDRKLGHGLLASSFRHEAHAAQSSAVGHASIQFCHGSGVRRHTCGGDLRLSTSHRVQESGMDIRYLAHPIAHHTSGWIVLLQHPLDRGRDDGAAHAEKCRERLEREGVRLGNLCQARKCKVGLLRCRNAAEVRDAENIRDILTNELPQGSPSRIHPAHDGGDQPPPRDRVVRPPVPHAVVHARCGREGGLQQVHVVEVRLREDDVL